MNVELSQPLLAQLTARALVDGITVEAELQRAAVHYVAWSHDAGEMRHPDDVLSVDTHLPSDRELL